MGEEGLSGTSYRLAGRDSTRLVDKVVVFSNVLGKMKVRTDSL